MANIQKRGERSFLLTVDTGFKGKKRIRKTRTIRIEDNNLLKTKKRLQEYLEKEWYKLKTEVEVGAYISPEKMTLSQFIGDWRSKYASNHLAESTLNMYEGHIKNHIEPALGELKLDQVQPIHILNFLIELEEKEKNNLSIRTIQDIHRILRDIFSRAQEWKVIKDNPVASVKKPSEKKKKKKEPNVYDENEIGDLFRALEKEAPHWRMFITLALAAGLRRSELLGLEWSHIDFHNATIHVQQAIVRGESGRPVIKDTKTINSDRLITLSPSVFVELRNFYKISQKEKSKIIDLHSEDNHDFVFRNLDGTHFYPTSPNKWWSKFIKERTALRYIRLHDLRHTSATLLINQGVHAKIISERLGHSDIRITMDTYGHALRSADKEAANKLDELFKKSL